MIIIQRTENFVFFNPLYLLKDVSNIDFFNYRLFILFKKMYLCIVNKQVK